MPRLSGRLLVLVTALACIAVGSVVAFAASFGLLSAAGSGTTAAAVEPCSTDNPTVDTRVGFHSASSRYEVKSVLYSGTHANCQSLPYYFTFADNSGPATYTDLGSLSGASFPSGALATLSFTDGSGPDVNSINSVNSQGRTVLVIVGP